MTEPVNTHSSHYLETFDPTHSPTLSNYLGPCGTVRLPRQQDNHRHDRKNCSSNKPPQFVQTLDSIIQQMNDFPKVSSDVTCKIIRIRKFVRKCEENLRDILQVQHDQKPLETHQDSKIDLFIEAMDSKDMTSHNNNLVLSH